MKIEHFYKILTFLIALVWLANGLFCKVLNLVPRHTEIVASILGDAYARPLTIAIGISEIFMAAWFVSKKWFRVNIIAQVFIVLTMNLLEFILVPELLLWGKFNSCFALLFVLVVYYYGMVLTPKILKGKHELA